MSNTGAYLFTEMIENKENHPCIYLLFTGNPINETFQPLYVGASTQPRIRKMTHFRSLKKGDHQNKRLQDWFNTHKDQPLEYMVLDYIPSYEHYVRCQLYANKIPTEDEYREHIVHREQHFISAYRHYGICNYNDASLISWRYNVGIKHSEATKQRKSNGIKRSYTKELREVRSNQNRARWSNKILCFGDIHLDTSIIPKVEKLFVEGNYDRLIFLGDELDSFYLDYKNAPVILNQLKQLSERYNKHYQRFIWLSGNHTLSYASDMHCSGFNMGIYKLVSGQIRALIRDGTIHPFYLYKGVLYSHAGFTNNWMNKIDGVDKTDKLKNLQKRFIEMDFDCFNQVGFARGGVGYSPSCLWADQTELLNDYLRTPKFNKSGKEFVWKQVVGHTPVKSIESHIDGNIHFCDTFSTYRDGSPIGDGTVLEVEDGRIFSKIKL